ncbi:MULTISPECIES: chemotaxis protein CheC [Dethiosulfovibrio]|uniref:Chemotaxis protein CheC n=2 Tax=Dethiosulfovibrio TaxID=47054 RepID=A0ABS9EP78_9BACT|nr:MULTISPECIES: chemotaxis protein CheC [Dethiosulfovibrio]MCF4113969.1 chemotaxis protein CheC [Dethiosulfovibrio russensis]MCF4141618.1 chemotaxis protein CheC [Dethiosulfovibrio marinus]MCF4143965.1 chemotaxis protein CheC [Dethiosulfovibrio acidaminovorans]
MEYTDFSPLHLDAIREVVNIGAGNAATALSDMLAQPVDMGVPRVELVSIYEVSEHFGPPEDLVAAVYTHAEGAFPCNLIFIQDEEAAQGMVDAMFVSRMDTDGRDFPQEMRDSALSELGNIILSSFLNAVSRMIGSDSLSISVPGVAHDMLGAILEFVASIFAQSGELALLVNTTLKLEQEGADIKGNIMMVPDPGALEILLSKLGVL